MVWRDSLRPLVTWCLATVRGCDGVGCEALTPADAMKVVPVR